LYVCPAFEKTVCSFERLRGSNTWSGLTERRELRVVCRVHGWITELRKPVSNLLKDRDCFWSEVSWPENERFIYYFCSI